MDRLPFSAILLLLLGVTALAGFVTGNLQRVWIPMLFGQAPGTGSTQGLGGAVSGAPAIAYSGDARSRPVPTT